MDIENKKLKECERKVKKIKLLNYTIISYKWSKKVWYFLSKGLRLTSRDDRVNHY